MSNSERLKRRDFLANILFAGGALTLASLERALAEPVPEGWDLPENWKNNPDPDWELPPDWKDPKPDRPQPRPMPHPRPRPRPRPTPPNPRGGVRPPHLKGVVKPPRPNG